MDKKRFISLFLAALTVLFAASAMSCSNINKTWDKNASSAQENISSFDESVYSVEESAYSAEDETSLADNPLFENETTIEKITIYAPNKTTGFKVNMTEDGKIGELIGFDIVYETENQNEIDKVLAMFNGWDPEDNIIYRFLDLSCDIYIRFGNALTLSYHSPGADINYYGTVENSYRYLPKKFGEFIDGILAK